MADPVLLLRRGQGSGGFLPILSTPRGMITSAYFFVCKIQGGSHEAGDRCSGPGAAAGDQGWGARDTGGIGRPRQGLRKSSARWDLREADVKAKAAEGAAPPSCLFLDTTAGNSSPANSFIAGWVGVAPATVCGLVPLEL